VAQKYIVKDKGRGELMHVRSWMKAVPKDAIIRVVEHTEGTVGRLVGEISAVRESEPGRLINHRDENRVNIHEVDADLVCKGKSR
jgi:hypothetical protein